MWSVVELLRMLQFHSDPYTVLNMCAVVKSAQPYFLEKGGITL